MKPGPLLSRPRIKLLDKEYLDAFHTLSKSRPRDMAGPGAIPVSDVLAYVNLVGVASGEERVKYLRLIQQMDDVFLEHAREEAKKHQNNKS